MFAVDPQKISAGLDKGVFDQLGRAMPGLVNPPAAAGSDERVHEFLMGIGRSVSGGPVRQCLEAGLWLLAGELDRCHSLCQVVPTALGSAWHAVMHRQEGDFWNSKYWWRRSGEISWERLAAERGGIIAAATGAAAAALAPLAGRYDPGLFVDLVEAHHGDVAWGPVLLDLQRWEWAALFIETFESAPESGRPRGGADGE